MHGGVREAELVGAHSPTVHVVIPTLNRCAIVDACLASLEDQAYGNVRVVVVDAGSTDSTLVAVRTGFPAATLLTCGNDKWWAGATNVGVRDVMGVANPTDLVLTLNDDTLCPSDYIASLVLAHGGRRAILGSVAIEAGTSTVLDAGVRVNWWTARFSRVCRGQTIDACADALSGLASVDLLSGRGTLIPVAAFSEIGPYDESALPHYGADYEFIARARRAGWRIQSCGQARLQSYPRLTGIDPNIARVSLLAMMRSLVSRRSSNCLWYRWVFAVKACPRAQLLVFVPLDTLRVVAGMLRKQLKFRFDNRQHPLGR